MIERDDATPDTPSWIADVDSELIQVRRYDTSDLLVITQYALVVFDDSVDDGFIVSSVAHAPEPGNAEQPDQN